MLKYLVIPTLLCVVVTLNLLLSISDFTISLKNFDAYVNEYTVEENWMENGSQGDANSMYGDGSCAQKGNPKLLQLLLQEWITTATQLNINYTLGDGSLLGAWRDGNIIPYDTDIDVYIDIRDMEKLEAFVLKDNKTFTDKNLQLHLTIQKDWRLPKRNRRFISCDGTVYSFIIDQCTYKEPVARIILGPLIHLDVFAFGRRNNRLHFFSKEIEVDVGDFFPLNKCKFMGLKTFCPRKPIRILKKLYGKNLQPDIICVNKLWIQNIEKEK